MDDLVDRVAVVTGAGSGIGLAIAEMLARERMHVVLADIDAAGLEQAAAAVGAHGGGVLAVTTDVSDARSMELLAEQAIGWRDRVHVLVNNAGVVTLGRSWELSKDDWDWIVGVDFWGVVNGVRSLVPHMIGHGEPAHVVNVSSMAGLAGTPRCAPYDAAKAAVIALTEDLWFELGELGVPVGATVVCPGYTATNIRLSQTRRPPRFGVADPTVTTASSGRTGDFADPSAIAGLCLDAIRRDQLYALADWDAWRPVVERRFASVLAMENPEAPRYPGS